MNNKFFASESIKHLLMLALVSIVSSTWAHVDNTDVIATIDSNKPLIEIARKAGWISPDEEILTTEDAEAVRNLGDAFYQKNWLTGFDEFKYFTNVTSLDAGTFRGCYTLGSITLPKSLQYIDMPDITSESGVLNYLNESDENSEYYYRSALDGVGYVQVDKDNPYYGSTNGILYDKDCKTLLLCPTDVSGDIQIPESVERIENFAFWGVYDNIGVGSNGNKFVNVKIPASVKGIGIGAFANSSLTIEVDDRNTEFCSDGRMLYNKAKTEIIACTSKGDWGGVSIEFPSNIERIGCLAFYGVNNGYFLPGELIIPQTVKYIGTGAFYGSSLENTVIESPETQVMEGAFAKTKFHSNGSVSFPEGTTTLPPMVFYRSELTHIQLPSTLTSLNLGEFAECMQLKEIAIPNSVRRIGLGSFMGCTALKKISLPDQLQSIDIQAFNGCSALETIHLPNSLSSIGGEFRGGAFQGCSSLKEIELPDNSALTLIGPVFSDCTSLERIKFKSEIESIPDEFASNCVSLKEINIPESVKSIGSKAFAGCSSLRSVVFPNSMEKLNGDVVIGCKSLVNLVLPQLVSDVTFSSISCDGCVSLTGLTIPDNIQTRHFVSHMTLGNSAVRSLVMLATTPPELYYDSDVFSEENEEMERLDYQNVTLYVPQGSKNAYQTADGWKRFNNIQEIDINHFIKDHDEVSIAFAIPERKAELAKIMQTEGELKIGNQFNFGGIDYVLSSIGKDIFATNESQVLDAITFPPTITKISDGAFNKCTAAAFIWNSDTPLTDAMFTDDGFGKNFMLYVGKEEIAQTTIVKNVIVNYEAQKIELFDNYRYYCPQAFTAKTIVYTHNYQMTTGVGTCSGWETIALPFDVTSIRHEDGRMLVPFATNWEGTNSKPFWLYTLSDGGFTKTTEIRANTPYLISMPNNSLYSSDFNLKGRVSFSAENVLVKQTDMDDLVTSSHNGYTFTPCYNKMEQGQGAYALNVSNDFYTYNGTEDQPGSVFIRDSRSINPFEAYFIGSATNVPKLYISFGKGSETTAINPLLKTNENQVEAYTLNGQKLQGKPTAKGIYIVNGRKVVIK